MLQATRQERTSTKSDGINNALPDGHATWWASLSQSEHRIDQRPFPGPRCSAKYFKPRSNKERREIHHGQRPRNRKPKTIVNINTPPTSPCSGIPQIDQAPQTTITVVGIVLAYVMNSPERAMAIAVRYTMP
jgi:hypothetical protein